MLPAVVLIVLLPFASSAAFLNTGESQGGGSQHVMIASGITSATEMCLTAGLGRGSVSLESCAIAVSVGDGRELFSFDAGKIMSSSGNECLSLGNADEVVLGRYDFENVVSRSRPCHATVVVPHRNSSFVVTANLPSAICVSAKRAQHRVRATWRNMRQHLQRPMQPRSTVHPWPWMGGQRIGPAMFIQSCLWSCQWTWVHPLLWTQSRSIGSTLRNLSLFRHRATGRVGTKCMPQM